MDTCEIIRPSSEVDRTKELLVAALAKFYHNYKRVKSLSEIILRQSKISLRILDWFVVSYSREKETRYLINERVFDVHASYKDQLNAFSKHHFDPFRRKNHVVLNHKHYEISGEITETNLNTCIGQLVFFRWCFDNKIIDYVERHYDEILLHLQMYVPDARTTIQDVSEDVQETCVKKKPRATSSRKRRVIPTTVKRAVPSNSGGYIVNFQ
jgi:hypothetical protein